MNVLAKIYEHLNLESQRFGCDVVNAPCSGRVTGHPHLYHVCCLKRWLNKREFCPLDNDYIPKDFDFSSCLVSFSGYSLKLDNVFSSDFEFVTRRQRKEAEIRVHTWIVAFTKMNFPLLFTAATLESIYRLNVAEENLFSSSEFVRLLNELTERGYFKPDENGGLYQFIR